MNTMNVNVESLVASKTNRKFFDQTALDELTANVAEVGVLQPLLVRKAETLKSANDELADQYEIVFGERRWRAACAAGLEFVPCSVRELSDREALELQLVENLQREDPDVIEEAQALQAMLDLEDSGVRCYSLAALAGKLGKSRRFVQDRLPLVNLTRPMADALRTGKLAPKTAALIGRLPSAAARKEVFGAVTKLELTFVATQDLIRREYQLSLKGAPFDREDAELQPKAGACGACPKRLGNMDAEAKDGQICCDPECFRAKCEARWVVVTDEARARGEVVLSDEDSRMQFGDDGKHLSFNSSYVVWEQRPPEDILKPEIEWRDVESWKDMVDDAVEPVLARVPATGRSVYLAKLNLCLTAAVQAGHGDIFRDATLRAYSAFEPKGATLVPLDNNAVADADADDGDEVSGRTERAAGDESAAVLDKSQQSQKEAREALAALRGSVKELVDDEAILCEPGQVPVEVWKLLIQSAAMNVGAAGRKLVENWFEIDESVWADDILSGKLEGFESFAYPVLLQAMLCCEWEPAHQAKFLGELLEYVSPVVEDDGNTSVLPEGAEEVDVPEGYRPASQTSPDMETPCDVICLDGSKHVACLNPVDFEDGKGEVETWLDNDCGGVLPSAVIGWEYWEEEE